MRNLLARRHCSELLDWAPGGGSDGAPSNGISFLAVDRDSGGLRYLASASGAVECLPPEGAGGDVKALWRASLPDILPSDSLVGRDAPLRLVAFAHVPEHEAVMAATACGALLLLSAGPEGFGELDEVGAVGAGLLDARWSPDSEVLALLTAEGCVVLMSLEWEVLGEVQSCPEEEEEEEGGALLAEEGTLDWRGDGQLLAVNVAWGGASKPRSVSVVRADPCELVSSAKGLEGLRGPLAWQPNGRHLYCVCEAPPSGGGAPSAPKSRVILLEANGLQHGGFDLVPSIDSSGSGGSPASAAAPEGGAASSSSSLSCTALAWSADSEMLGTVVSDSVISTGAASSGAGCTLQVWRRSNWRWDLKHEIRFPFAKALGIQWDAEQGGCLRAFTACGELHTLHYDLQPCVSALGTAAVIDGPRLRLTPLRQCVVPPPLCAVTLGFPAAVQCASMLACGPSGGREAAAAVLADGTLAAAWSVEEDLWEETAEEEEEEDEEGGALALRASVVQLSSPSGFGGRLVRHLVWTGPSGLLAVASPLPGEPGDAGDVLIPVELAAQSSSCSAAGVVGVEVPAGGQVLAVAQGPDDCVFLQVEGKGTFRYFPGAGRPEPVPPPSGVPVDCRWIAAVPKAGGQAVEHLLHHRPVSAAVVGLTGSGALHWGGAPLASGVTSAALRPWGPGGAFLLFTTRDHMMHTLTLLQADERANGTLRAMKQSGQLGASKGPTSLTYHPGSRGKREAPIGTRRDGEENHYSDMHAAMKPGGAAAADCTVRRIEAGGMLVASQPGSHTAVLQMPRGNLEVVEPRHLVLAAVTSALGAFDFGSAWRIARETRLDLNIIVDYRWPAFLNHGREFVQAVKKEADICDLMAALTASSTLQPGGEYEAVLASSGQDMPEAVNAPQDLNKVAEVCCSLREALVAEDEQGYTIAILTSHARHDPPDLAGALERIKGLREAEVAGGRGGPSDAPAAMTLVGEGGDEDGEDVVLAPMPAAPEDRQSRAVAGLRSLLLYTSPEVLYRAALALYDLPLAYLVVDTAGLDPGDYLGELQLWLSLEPLAARHAAIDRHLGNWAGALTHLAGIEGEAAFEEALALARSKGLLRLAMSLYKEQPEYHNRVLRATAESLAGRGKHEDAAVAWLAAGDQRSALESYVEAGEWRQAMALGNALRMDRSDLQAMARSLAEEMRGSMGPGDAAVLYLDYLEDVDGAVVLYTQAQDWREAVRAAQRFDRGDLVKTVVVPAAAAAAANVLRETRENIERVAKYSSRLKEVRTKRIALSAMIAADNEQFDGDDGDAESLVSGMSAYTAASTAAGTGTGSSLTGGTPSTLGGRRAQGNPRKKNKQRKKGSGIRQGTVGEEHGLVEHLKGLQPSAQELSQAGHLCELLVLHGHLDDAAQIQSTVAALVNAASSAYEEAAANPPPPLSGDAGGENAPLGAGAAAAAAPAWKWDILRGPEPSSSVTGS